MKRIVLTMLAMFLSWVGLSQPVIMSPSFPSSVSLFDKFEVSFTMGASYSNPYDPDVISVYAIFTAPGGTDTYTVNAFYYEDYSFHKIIVGNDYYEKVSDSLNNVGWRIRFTPTQIGTWKFRIIAKGANGAMAQMPNNGPRNYSFTCTSVENGDGFISKANTRFLKRDVVKNGVRQFHSFFPIGPNIGWYSCRDYGTFQKPRGIYDYERYIDSLSGNANYMRIWLNRYQYLSLYGPEYTHRDLNDNPVVYFDNTINQKDSAELDHIITYALQHGVTIMPCIFSFGDFRDVNPQDIGDPSVWWNNPYYTELGLLSSCDFFTDAQAMKITKNLIRYIVSRWGYATNIMSWELWNEVSNMFYMENIKLSGVEQDAINWHQSMADYIMKIDPFHHCITTSTGNIDNHPYIYSVVFDNLDFAQQHNYQNIQKAKSREQISNILYNRTNDAHTDYPSLPFFMGEFGFGQGSPSPSYAEKDPFGIDLHNSLWSSMFSTAIGPASFWWWHYLDSCGLFKRFAPIMNFCENLPILSDSFYPGRTGEEIGHKLVFPNNIETYYMINADEDTIYGWSQDTALAYQSLRWLTDSVRLHSDTTGGAFHFVNGGVFDPLGYVYSLNPTKRPQPSSNSNAIEIPITNQPIGSIYSVKWYNSETGSCFNTGTFTSVHLNANGEKVVSFSFPSFIRDLQNHTINNTFGDAVFSLILSNNSPSDE